MAPRGRRRHPLGQGPDGHASIGETEGTYGHLVREHHERDVDALDAAFRATMVSDDDSGTPESLNSRRPAASHCVPPAAGQSLSADQSDEELMVEGKGFVGHISNNRALMVRTLVQNAAERGTARNQAQPRFWRTQREVSSGTQLKAKRYPDEKVVGI